MHHLNPEQHEATLTIEGPALIIAGAGSGKTLVVTHRIVHLLEIGVPSSSILGVTFTNKAAGEMRERVRKATHQHVLISTFHSLGAKILRESISSLGYRPDFSIYDEEDALKLLKTCLADLEIDEKKSDAKAFRHLISTAKNDLKTADQIDESDLHTAIEMAFPKVYARYQDKLKEYNALDFDDLLFLTVQLWENHPEVLAIYQERWPYVLIDEYQDVNASQYRMTNLLVEKSKNLFVVGDPDQSIYSWRGANIKNILNFEKDYPGAKVIKLEQNYRSYSTILDAANALISHNDNFYQKKLWSSRGEGEKIRLFVANDEKEEANFVARQMYQHHTQGGIPYHQMVVFYRTNAQSRPFEDTLLMHNIPYQIIGGISFYQRKEIKDVLAFLRMAYSGSDYIAFSRTINLPKRGFGEATVDKISDASRAEGVPLYTYMKSLVDEHPLRFTAKLSAKQRKSLADYLHIIGGLIQLTKGQSLRDLVKGAIEDTGYLAYLKEDPDTFEDRKSNLDELITKAVEWELTASNPTLGSFLEELVLKSSVEDSAEEESRVSLMTLHNGKGLEFKITFLVGLEEDLLPHANARGSDTALQEERRLCYVGITRAKDCLYLSYSMTRYLWGTERYQRPSRFLNEIPKEYLQRTRPSYRFSS
jgi:DNA helicase II / ATP-dependent DNA helicase PcrA